MGTPVVLGRLVGALESQPNKLYVDIPLVSKVPVPAPNVRCMTVEITNGNNQIDLGPLPAMSSSYRVIVCFPDDFPIGQARLKGALTDLGLVIPTRGTTMMLTYDNTRVGSGNFIFFIQVFFTDPSAGIPFNPQSGLIEVYVF